MKTYQVHTDAVLAALLKESDEQAFYEIYNRYHLILLHHAQLKLRNREESRDVVQEVFASLWRKRDALELVKENLSGYLYAAVRNSILNYFARQDVQHRYQQSLKVFADRYESGTDYLIREKQLTAAIESEIQALPERMRKVFELSRKEHLNHREIAERLGISERTVSSHITHALKILKNKFGPYVIIYVL